jgi:hypothetical protein
MNIMRYFMNQIVNLVKAANKSLPQRVPLPLSRDTKSRRPVVLLDKGGGSKAEGGFITSGEYLSS